MSSSMGHGMGTMAPLWGGTNLDDLCVTVH